MDPIMCTVMKQPVVLNEKVYDWATVLTFKGIDPTTKLEFQPRDVTPSRLTVASFEKLIKQIEATRESAAELEVAPPGGLGFH